MPPLRKTPQGSAARFAGVPAGPAEAAGATGFSTGHLGSVGEPFHTTARVAGTIPRQPGAADDVVHRCLRTVDSGLALCCPVPTQSELRIGSVVEVSGVVTGHRRQGSNDITEVRADTINTVG